MEWRENQSINEPTSPKNTKKTYSFVSPLYWLHTSRVRPSKWFPWRKSNKKERGRNNLRNSKKKNQQIVHGSRLPSNGQYTLY